MLVSVNLETMASGVKNVKAVKSPPAEKARRGGGAATSGGKASAEGEAREGEPRRRNGAARRVAIFEAALRLFRERGFHGTSINDIGAATGVTGPAIYRHFASKEEVLAEAIAEGARRVAEATRDALVDEDLPAEEALEALVRSYVKVAIANADFYAAYMLEARHLRAPLLKPLRGRELRHRHGWRRLVQELNPDMEPEEVRTLVKMALFSVTSLCMEPSRLPEDQLVESATRWVLAMLRPGHG